MNESPTHLYLIRHGQAVSNVEPIMAGMKGDKGLTPLGVRQAEQLRDRLAGGGEIKADVLIASTLPRARQTAQIIAPALGAAIPFLLDDEVHELRVGEAGDGLTHEQYSARFGWVDLDNEPLRPVDPGGESWGRFTLRVGEALTRITSEHRGKTIVVVCHGGVIDASFLFFFQMPTLVAPPAGFHTHNTSITHWEWDPHEKRGRWRLHRYNDHAHLRGLEAADPPAVPLPTETTA